MNKEQWIEFFSWMLMTLLVIVVGHALLGM